MSNRVYRLGTSNDSSYPEIDFLLNSRIDWYRVGEMLDGALPLVPTEFQNFDLRVQTNQTFDVLRLDHRLIVSAPAKECFTTLGLVELEYIATTVNGRPFFHLRVCRTIDCLDREASNVEFFPGSDARIMAFRKCVIRKDAVPDPAIFRIPESRTRFFATESVERAVGDASLVGFRFVDCDNPPLGESAF